MKIEKSENITEVDFQEVICTFEVYVMYAVEMSKSIQTGKI